MKKILACAISATLLCGAMVTFAACGENDSSKLSVYTPDGAPALALVNAIKKEDNAFAYNVVDANVITTFVTGENPKADIAVLPVNAAAKVLGTGSVYQMLGTVTNGNLYFLTTGDHVELTGENLAETLAGKKVGVVQLNNVPGLTLQAVLNDYEIDYSIVQSAQEDVEEGKVNLIPFVPENVTPASGCDYYLCPEPAASTKVKATEGKFKMAGDLQALYGEEGGYPQAAVVAKKSVIENRKEDVETFIGYLQGAKSYLETAEISHILAALDENREDGLNASFKAENLTREVIARCSVGFTASSECKSKVNEFLNKLIAVSESSTAIPSDAFYYMG